MDFSTTINNINQDNLNAISDYNRYLNGSASFDFNPKTSGNFSDTLEAISKSIPLKDKNAEPNGLGNFMNNIGTSFSNGLNAVNDAKIMADKMQEDIAMGGPTSIHDAMIAAEKASLSLKMATQVRNKIIEAYTQITSMAI